MKQKSMQFPRHEKSDFHCTGKSMENTNISNSWVWVKQKSIQFPKHGKSEFSWYGKSIGKNKHSKVMDFSNSLGEAETLTISKTWQRWISIVWEKHGKTQTFQIYGFLKYFRWSKNPYNSQNMGKNNLLSTGKVWENIEVSHILCYFTNLELMRTHAILNVWECTNSHKMEIFCGKPYHSIAVGVWGS